MSSYKIIIDAYINIYINSPLVPEGGAMNNCDRPSLNGPYMGISGSNFVIDPSILVPVVE